MGTAAEQGLSAVRSRWQEILREPRSGLLRVALLASYTIDPVLPYLGVALEKAGLPIVPHVGPFNQIVQQCLDDDSPTARHRPDVLVVAPRFEELGADGAGHPAELRRVVDAASAAAARWHALLVVVLPAVPAHDDGVFAEAATGGAPSAAAEARETVRALLAGRPEVLVVDAEQAVRAVGSRNAHHDALWRFARIPYTEAVFAELGGRLAAVLRAVFGATPRAVLLDADALRVTDLAGELRSLRRGGVHIGLRATGYAEWTEVADLLDTWTVGEAPVRGVPERSTVLIRGADDLRRCGVFDRIPAPVHDQGIRTRPAESTKSPKSLSLDDFVASLDVEVDCGPAGPDLAKAIEVVSRAKDFTLGGDPDLTDPGREVIAVRVRDRFGDYGISGAVGLRRAGEDWVVDVFSLSCPVLGKGVQDRVLADIRGRTGGRVTFRHCRTPHNEVATRFLAESGSKVEEMV
ncbi:MAG: hypothetical protein WBA97_06290 [Actinophytocola sp.]|uniref:hypothetical protein n=1 Tax=Actinophytocola sp. TaxID=1872138 RepID=UPI003C72E829